jgi:lysophospholipase L1-like esterase
MTAPANVPSVSPAARGAHVLRSKTAWALLWFWMLLGLLLLIPGPLRDRLISSSPTGREQTAGSGGPSLPGLPAKPAPTSAQGAAPASPRAPSAIEPIQDPRGSLAHFYQRLAKTAAKQKGALTRVIHYGDSLIDLDHITGPLRKRLQQRFGDGGHGFVLAAKPWSWYNHPGVAMARSSGWEQLCLVGQGKKDPFVGLGCFAIQAAGRQWVQLSTRVKASRLEVHYLKMPGGGELLLKVDEGPVTPIATHADRKGTGVFKTTLADRAHRYRLSSGGRVRLFGLVLEREGPGITWENLPLISARFSSLAHLQADHFREQLTLRNPDLVVFQFGANDTISFGGSLERYGKRVRVVLDRMKQALPKASCLVIGPLDRLQRDDRGRLRSPATVRRVSDRQREVALAAGCAFFDGQQAMGGPGSMEQWLKQGQTLKDMVHLNPKGSRRFAGLLERALLAKFSSAKEP